MLMIAAGYEDCDDIDALRTDPALKIACGRCPVTGADLMSQPTLSRLKCSQRTQPFSFAQSLPFPVQLSVTL